MQRVLSNQGGTPRLVPVRPSSSAVPTPQRLSTPVGRPGPSRRTSSPGHAPPPPTTTTTTPSRAPTTTTREHGTVGSESTMTLTQKPVGPAGAVASHSGAGARTTNVVKRPPPASEATMDSTSSSSSSSGDDEAERRREEAEETSNRLKELAKMMSSDMLGFARQQQPRASPSAVGGGLSSTTTPRSVRTAHDGSRSQSQASRIRQPSPSRGRQFGTASVIHEAATSRQPDQPTSASHYPDFSQRPQSIASRSKSGHDSIPSIPSPTESQSPARSSMSPTQSTSPSAGNPSRSPSMVSPADAMMQQQHAKRQSLDGAPSAMGTVRAPRSGGGAPVVQPGTAASASAQGRPRASKRPPSSTQGSSASSFSDISGQCLDPQRPTRSIMTRTVLTPLMNRYEHLGERVGRGTDVELHEAGRLKIVRNSCSLLLYHVRPFLTRFFMPFPRSMFAPSQYGGGARGGSQQRL